MVDVDRFLNDEIIDCQVHTSTLWDAECILSELTVRGPSAITERGEVLKRVIDIRRLVESFGGSIGSDLDDIRVPLLFSEMILTKSLSLDEDSLVDIQDSMDDANEKVQIILAFEFAECLLDAEKFRQVTGSKTPVVFPGSLGVSRVNL